VAKEAQARIRINHLLEATVLESLGLDFEKAKRGFVDFLL
jgi:pyridoxal biosynthesis lyase PdxS